MIVALNIKFCFIPAVEINKATMFKLLLFLSLNI